MSPLMRFLTIFAVMVACGTQCAKACHLDTSFGCKPWVDCMPCSEVRDLDGEPQTFNEPGWCYIRGKK